MSGEILIPLRHRGKVVNEAIVDAADEYLCEYRWTTTPAGPWTREWGYAQRHSPVGALSMHRQVCGLVRGDGRLVHHVNQVKFDNRRSNLVVCSQEQHKNFAHDATTGRLVIRGRLLLLAFGSDCWNRSVFV